MNKLTQEMIRAMFDYDPDTGLLTRKLKSGKRKLVGHKPTCHGYGYIRIGDKLMLTHRVIWLWYYGSMPEGEIDHIDHDKMNNRLDNLRDVTPQENQHNYSIRVDNTSGFPGVHWDKSVGKYKVNIRKDNKTIHIGLFSSFDDAVRASKLAKIKYHPTSPIAKEWQKGVAYEEQAALLKSSRPECFA